MKIQVLSDLHLEFLSPSQIETIIGAIEARGDVLVLAGDIGDGTAPHYKHFIEKMSQKFKKVFLVAGNHEYYGHNIIETNEKIRSLCDSTGNVSFLCSSWEDYMGFRWIGCTLWSRVDDTGKCMTNDVRCIRNMPVSKYNERHTLDVGFLTDALRNSHEKQCIVITHYIPSMELIHEKYKGGDHQPYNQWFASSLDDLIHTYSTQTPLWIYGHTHDPSRVRMSHTDMVCNPVGYEGENKNPNLNLIVELNA